MSLSRFIAENSESILAEFEEFARTHTTAGDAMDIAALRDHAAAMLATIALDISQHQSVEEQEVKSKGDATLPDDPAPTAAEKHGTDRAVHGFTLAEMFAEYRALRASVLRLWTDAGERRLDEKSVEELIRFNEAIDQSLAESITRFSTDLERGREIFLAILGHDLRTPLGAIVAGSEILVSEEDLGETNRNIATRIRSSAKRMTKLIADLLDFTTARLGRRIPITRADADLAEITREAVAEIGGQFPDRDLRFVVSGETSGRWDAQRMSQVVSNLIGNAVQHGAPGTEIRVEVRATADEVVVSVHNKGSAIPAGEISQIFSPFKRVQPATEQGAAEGSMGLGLYIAQQIAVAHGGWIEVRSPDEDGTTFLLHVPRLP